MNDNQFWEIRAFVYQHFVEATRAPGVDEATRLWKLSQRWHQDRLSPDITAG